MIPSIRLKHSLRLLLTGIFAVGFFLSFATPTLAACCRCQAPGEAKADICLNKTAVDCAALPAQSKNSAVKNLTCVETGDACATISNGGTCVIGPMDDVAYTAKNAAGTAPAPETQGTNSAVATIVPQLNVAIPGLSFSQNLINRGGFLEVPFLSQYIAAAYKYLIGVSAIAAAIMIVYGGFLYIVSSTGATASKGKTYIVDAAIGLVILLGAYTILQTVNPDTLTLNSLRLDLIRPNPMSYLGGRFDAVKTLSETGFSASGVPGTGKDHAIPLSCPGRDSAYSSSGKPEYINVAGLKVPKSNYSLNSRGRTLDEKTIAFYMKEQERTGVPAAVIIAQMMTEAGRGSIYDLVNGQAQSIYFNYGGIGCTQRQVPQGACAHVAFGAQAFEFSSKKPHPLDCSKWNTSKDLASSCVSICQSASRDTYTNCGDGCYPQKSHASIIDNGVEVWIPSVQCSRRFKTPQEFLDSHLGFVKPCLGYADSVYKFAYCIGASSYAGVTGSKGIILAEIIERNCLCDPKTDSLGCVRNKELEQQLAKNIIKKRNLYDSRYRLPNGDIDHDAISQALYESTKGLLKPNETLPQNDIDIPPDAQ